MHRRPLGSGRRLAGVAAVVILAACFLPWWQTSGELGIQLGGNAFDGAGVIVFFDSLAVLALLALPYAAGDVPVSLDRSLSFVILAVLGWVAWAIRLVDLASANLEAIFPQRAYGLWLAALGLLILSRAAYDITREPARR
jgi:hypothetical protein